MRALLDLVDDDTTLITVNRRLSRAVTEAYADRRIAAGERAWRTPDVIPFSAWVERGWRTSAAHGFDSSASLLRPSQERVLWEQVVRAHAPRGNESDAPVAAGAAARRAQEANALVSAWNFPLEAAEFGFSAESRIFRTWARAFEARCLDGGWIDPARAASALADHARLALAKPRRRAVFAGFDAMTLQQHAIRAALVRCGVEVIDAAAPQIKGQISYRTFDDRFREIEAAAMWARGILSRAPRSRIGVVVPDLHRERPVVERIFDELLSPGSSLPVRDTAPRQFNLSYGLPASRIEVVGDALIALKLSRDQIELAEAGRLLRSPYFSGGNRGAAVRARVDAQLRDTGEPEVSLSLLAVRAGQDQRLGAALRDLVALRSSAPNLQPLISWSAFFSNWLSQLGWPGDRTLDSAEFQAVETFRGLLDELAGMGSVAGPVGLDRALSLLLKLADEHLFQPRTGPAPVQILGVLETAGLDFDGLWVSGLHDGSWPPAPEPDPFVPISLQRNAGLPTASPEGQLGLAKRRLEHWLGAAGQVVLSYPRFNQDEPLRPSPLLKGAVFEQETADEDATLVGFSACLNRARTVLETVSDELAPEISETRITRGGATVLGDQAACPFRAFARWRLHAEGVPVAASPLDARVRGNLVHAVLNDLWSEIRTQAALNALSSEDLSGRISAAVARALERERRARPDTLHGTFARVEQERLCALIKEWMRIEKRRAPFEVVAREIEIQAAVGPLSVRIRPDRVDRLESGEHFVIDYKTGSSEVRDWFGNRPDAPQLPVYTLAFEAESSGGTVAGAAYGTLKRGALGFKGLAERDDVADGVSTPAGSKVNAAKTVADWAKLKSEWRATLETLAESFAGGDARVDPKSPHQICVYCDVMPVCRVFEQRVDAGGDEDQT